MTKYSLPITELIKLPPGIDSIKESLSEVFEKIGLTNIDISVIEPLIPSDDLISFTIESQEDLDALYAEENQPPADDFADDDIPDEESDSDVPIAETLIFIEMELQVLRELVYNLSFLEGVSFILNPCGFNVTVKFNNCQFIGIGATIGLGLRFSKDYLKPMKKNAGSNGNAEYELDPDKEYVQIEIAEASILVDSNGDIDFEGGLGVRIQDPVMIGDTGIILEDIDMVLNLSGDGSKPAGTPDGWKGLMITSAKLSIPDVFNGSIDIVGLGIGSGGVSGTISGDFPIEYNKTSGELKGDLVGEIFGMYGGLESISLTLQQNIPAGGDIQLKLLLPFFEGMDKPLNIGIGISADGGFAAEISSEDGILELEKEGLINLKVDSIGFSLDDGTWAATIAGKIKPLFGDINWPEVDIKALTIDSKGNVAVDGGWLEVPKQMSVDFHGFKLELTKIGFGKEENDIKWLGMSGGINIVEGIPLRAGVEGLKIKWHPDDTFSLEIKGMNVGFEVEDVLKFQGEVFFIDEPYNKGFKGSVKMVLYPLDGMMIDVQFIAGKNELDHPYNYFYLFIGVELPIGIPLGNTGASLYGMAGLFGYNMLMNKEDTEAWFEENNGSNGFYKKSPVGLTSMKKWTDVRDGLAFGAGITLGTASDNGFTFSCKVLLAILIPGPVILIEGKASVLQDRGALTGGDPPFRMLAVLDCTHGELLINVDALYKFPEKDGMLIDIGGSIDVYFNFNDPNIWHVYLGEKNPLSKRIKAKIAVMFDSNGYFMIDPEKIEIGAWASLFHGFNIEFVKIGLFASFEGTLGMSYKPVQGWGSFSMEIGLIVKVWEFGFKFSFFALMEMTTPNPWSIRVEFQIRIDLPWPLDDIVLPIVLKWEEDKVPPIPIPISNIGIEHLKVSEKWELQMFGEVQSDSVIVNSPVVPPDARPVLNFEKAVKDCASIGEGSSSSHPPSENSDNYTFSYRLINVRLYRKSIGKNRWHFVDGVKGKWQMIPDGPKNVKLMLWANTTFDIHRSNSDETTIIRLLAHVMENQPDYPCPGEEEPNWICVDFEELVGSMNDEPLLYYPFFMHKNVTFYSKFPMIIFHEPNWTDKDSVLALDEPYIPVKICIEIDKIKKPEGQRFSQIEWKDIIFKTYSDENFYMADHYPTVRDGKNELRIIDSDDSPQASIEFPGSKFIKGPDRVYINCVWKDSLSLKAYNDTGKLIDKKEYKANSGKNMDIVLSGDNIRKIDIDGTGVGIIELCYEKQISVEHTTDAKISQKPVALFEDEEFPELKIVFPEQMAEVHICFTKGSKGNVIMYNSLNEIIGEDAFEFVNTPENKMSAFTVTSKEKNMEAIKISGKFKIAEIYYMTKKDSIIYEYNTLILGWKQSEILSETWNHQGAVLEPNSYYRLEVDTETYYEKVTSIPMPFIPPITFTSEKTEEHTHYAYFQTGNPPGAYEKTDAPREEIELDKLSNESEHYPDSGPLKDLSPYVLKTIPEQAASNEPQRPFYRAYDVGIIFNEGSDEEEGTGYVENMYLMANLPLGIRLFDNNDQPVLDVNGDPVEFVNKWGKNPELDWTIEEEFWKKLLINKCGKDDTIILDENKNVRNLTVNPVLLKPETKYKAKLFAGDRYSVYEFNFITSRYCHFIHQIHSFDDVLWDHYKIENNDSFDSSALNDVLSQFTSFVKHVPENYNVQVEADAFDNIMDVMNLGTRQFPEQVEITLLNDNTKSYGLLMESAEPLEWKRLEMEINFNPGIGRKSPLTAQQNYSENYIELTLKESVDLSGYCILYKNAGERKYSEYYKFKDEKKFSSGDTIRIYSPEESRIKKSSSGIIQRITEEKMTLNESGSILIKDTSGNIFDYTSILYETVYDLNSVRVHEARHIIKIINKFRDDYNKEYIELLIRKETDINEIIIEYKKLEDENFNKFFKFENKEKFIPGSIIRVYAGSNPDDENTDYFISGIKYCFADGSDRDLEKINEIRIKNKKGEILHSKVIAVSESKSKESIIIRNKDNTRAFLFFPQDNNSISNLSDGRYSFNFVFKRNMQGLPLLKYHGASEAEKTTIEFNVPAYLPDIT